MIWNEFNMNIIIHLLYLLHNTMKLNFKKNQIVNIMTEIMNDLDGQGILSAIRAIWLINSTPRAIDYFKSWLCVID